MTEQPQLPKATKGNGVLIVVCIILVLVTGAVIMGVALNAQKNNQEMQAKLQSDAAAAEKRTEARKAQLATCIKAANDLHAEYSAKTLPDSMSTTDKLAYLQTIAQLWDSYKADCDRQYGSNP